MAEKAKARFRAVVAVTWLNAPGGASRADTAEQAVAVVAQEVRDMMLGVAAAKRLGVAPAPEEVRDRCGPCAHYDQGFVAGLKAAAVIGDLEGVKGVLAVAEHAGHERRD